MNLIKKLFSLLASIFYTESTEITPVNIYKVCKGDTAPTVCKNWMEMFMLNRFKTACVGEGLDYKIGSTVYTMYNLYMGKDVAFEEAIVPSFSLNISKCSIVLKDGTEKDITNLIERLLGPFKDFHKRCYSTDHLALISGISINDVEMCKIEYKQNGRSTVCSYSHSCVVFKGSQGVEDRIKKSKMKSLKVWNHVFL